MCEVFLKVYWLSDNYGFWDEVDDDDGDEGDDCDDGDSDDDDGDGDDDDCKCADYGQWCQELVRVGCGQQGNSIVRYFCQIRKIYICRIVVETLGLSHHFNPTHPN